MVKHLGAGDARTRIPGLFYQTFNRKLQKTITHAWPKKRPVVSPKTAAANKTFATAMKMVKFAAGENRVAAGDYVAGKPFLPQDALMASTFGTLFDPVILNGATYRSVRIMSAEIQSLLDSISSVQGSMLVRGNNGWAALLPGTDKQVLTYDATAGQPDWQTASGGGGGGSTGFFQCGYPQSVALDAFASLGWVIHPTLKIKITDIIGIFSKVVGESYTMSIAPFSTATKKITGPATVSPATAWAAAGDYQQLKFSLPAALVLNPGDVYIVWASRVDSTGVANTRLYKGTSISAPITPGFTYMSTDTYRVAVTAPGLTDVWSTQLEYPAVGIIYSLV